MPRLRQPSALLRHATEAGDRALVALIADRLAGRAISGPGTRAFVILVRALEIGDVKADDFSDG